MPALVIHAVDDPLASYGNARSMAGRIPGARLITVESGGHMLLGQGERIRAEVEEFLKDRSDGNVRLQRKEWSRR